MTFVVTIVHGTVPFRRLADRLARLRRKAPADPAPWARRDSPLCAGLVDGLAGEVVFSDFRWSGANSAQVRAIAAESLQRHLEGLLEEYPDAHHVVLAHSHGGNITLRALRSERLQRQLGGVACLSTPFIVVVDRAGWLVPAYVALLYLSAVLGLVTALGTWWAFDALAASSGWWRLLYLAVPWIAFGTLATRSVSLAHELERSWKRKVALPDLTWLASHRLLILRGVGDEANSFLSSAQLVAWGAGGAIRRAAVLIGSLHDRIERPFRKTTNRAVKWPGYVAAACLLLGLSMLAGVLLLPIMLTLICASVVTWGVQLGLLSPLLELSAESTPPGTWQVTQLEGHQRGGWVDLFGTELTTLAHSTVYSDARAIKSIVDWMAANAAASGRPQGSGASCPP